MYMYRQMGECERERERRESGVEGRGEGVERVGGREWERGAARSGWDSRT